MLANIPVVAASLIMTKGCDMTVNAGASSGRRLFRCGRPPRERCSSPAIFRRDVGGNAAVIGTSKANIVAVGICEAERVTFMRFRRAAAADHWWCGWRYHRYM
ncbi:MAG: hypothetical protein IPH73_14690 [Rhodocyclales bacterium]|nr:hypothetical protein [Rhodocyclales bacterium]